MLIYKLADGDTRLFESWKASERRDNSKKIDPKKDICLFTEVKDGYYNYEGTNLLVDCDHANTYRSQAPGSSDGTYGRPKDLQISTGL